MRKRTLMNMIIVILTIAGLSLILYPMLSDYLKTRAFNKAIREYTTAVENIEPEVHDEILQAARKYNEQLAQRSSINIELSDEERVLYESLLNVSGNGVIGYVEISKIKVSLPIYHGTSEAVLQSGIGHLEGSSLPIGGESTHSVISGHRGLSSAVLFTNIDRLTYGDTFNVRVLGETLTYEVDQILTVLPHELQALNIEEGEDLCTLLTCTPYGVNTHRLLVRGHRIATPPEPPAAAAAVSEVIRLVQEYSGMAPVTLIVIAGALVLLTGVFIVLVIGSLVGMIRNVCKGRKGGKNTKNADNDNENTEKNI